MKSRREDKTKGKKANERQKKIKMDKEQDGEKYRDANQQRWGKTRKKKRGKRKIEKKKTGKTVGEKNRKGN